MRFRTLPLCAAILLLSAHPTFADPAAATQPAAAAATERIDLELSDTNVRDYVDYLAHATGGNFILFASDGVDPRAIAIPGMRLRQLAVADAVNLLTQLPNANIEVSHESSQPVLTFIIRINDAIGVRPAPGPATQTRIFPLERMLFGEAHGGIDADAADARTRLLVMRTAQAVELIEQALLLDAPEAKLPQLKLHEATHTLLIKGTSEQIAIVAQALDALKRESPVGMNDDVTWTFLAEKREEALKRLGEKSPVFQRLDAMFQAVDAATRQRTPAPTTRP